MASPDAARGGPRRETCRGPCLLADFRAAARPATPPGWPGCCSPCPTCSPWTCPAWSRAAGYPGTSDIPATHYLLSLLALKLTATRRVSHVDDLAADPGAALFAGLTALPKTTALTTYSYRLHHAKQAAFLTALDKATLPRAWPPATSLNLDFHAVMHWGADAGAGKALRTLAVPTHPQRADILRRRRRQPHPALRQRRPVQGHPEQRGAGLRRPLAPSPVTTRRC